MSPRLYALSAPTAADLERATEKFAADPDDGMSRPDRHAYAHRRVVVADTPAEAARRLREGRPGEVFTAEAGGERPVVFMFSGVGDQYAGMGAELYRKLPAFRRELDRCLAVLSPEAGADLREVLYPAGRERSRAPDLAALFDRRETTEEIHRTVVAQPLAFAIQYALARALLGLGVTPSALIGYSVGEYVAACLSGVFSLEDALRVVALRARLVERLPGGAMLAVLAPADELAAHVRDGVSIAALDGPALTVLAGTSEAIDRAGREIAEKGVACRRLATGHAFHSPLMEPVVEPLREAIAAIPLGTPSIPFLSNSTGTWIGDREATDPSYWARHLRRPIRFADGMAEIGALDRPTTIELGPGRTLTNLTAHDGLKLRTLPGVFESRGDLELLLTTLGRLWATGAHVSWAALGEGP